MIHKSYTIRFVLHRRKDTARQYLQMRVTPRGGKPISFATGITLADSEWDPLLGRAKGRSAAAAEANTLMAQWSQMVANIFMHYDSLHIVPTAEQLRQAFASATTAPGVDTVQYVAQPSPVLTLMQAYTQFVVERQKDNSWSKGTVAILHSFRHLLADFAPAAPMSSIDVAFMERFHDWLVKERKQQGTTVNGNLVKMRWFLHWAKRRGLYSGTADSDYRPKVKGASSLTRSIVYLTREELRKVEEFEFDEFYLKRGKDLFLFGCYTGLRASDMIRLRAADCHGDHITFTTQKTNHTLTVPLNDRAKAILEKHRGCKPTQMQRSNGVLEPALPMPSLKQLNRGLRIIMKMAGIDEPVHHVYYIGSERHDETLPKWEMVTTHTARHTFIVTAISLGIPVPVIMEWTGHSGYNAMRPYIAIANDTSTQAMQRFNDL